MNISNAQYYKDNDGEGDNIGIKFNGWMAMLGVTAALGAYATTGQIIPGIF